jgi:hypothetical protein
VNGVIAARLMVVIMLVARRPDVLGPCAGCWVAALGGRGVMTAAVGLVVVV